MTIDYSLDEYIKKLSNMPSLILSFKEQMNFHSRPSFIIARQIYLIYFTNSFRCSLVDDTFCIAAAAVRIAGDAVFLDKNF